MVFRRSAVRLFFHQRDTPMLPQMPVEPSDFKARIGYFIGRNAIVKHDPHPLETELANIIDRDHSRYARIEDESVTHFFSRNGISIDVANRSDPKQIQQDLFGIEAYTEALQVTLSRFAPAKRVQPHDFIDPFDESLAAGPPVRQTLNRRMADHLYLIVRDAASQKWSIPFVDRKPAESLRMTLERGLASHHPTVSTYTFSNCPQAVLEDSSAGPLYIFTTTYLGGRPNFSAIEPMIDNHAWVTRSELSEYEFSTEEMLHALRDIAVSNYFDGRGLH